MKYQPTHLADALDEHNEHRVRIHDVDRDRHCMFEPDRVERCQVAEKRLLVCDGERVITNVGPPLDCVKEERVMSALPKGSPIEGNDVDAK